MPHQKNDNFSIPNFDIKKNKDLNVIDKTAQEGLSFLDWHIFLMEYSLEQDKKEEILKKYNISNENLLNLEKNEYFNKLKSDIDNVIKDLNSKKYIELKQFIAFETILNNVLTNIEDFTIEEKNKLMDLLSKNLGLQKQDDSFSNMVKINLIAQKDDAKIEDISKYIDINEEIPSK